MKITDESVVLVTGANGGLGAAIARGFKARGAKVILSGRRPDALAPLAEELSARVVVADLSKKDDVSKLAEETHDADIAILNAAVPGSGSVLEYDAQQIDRALDVNLRAPIHTARSLAVRMVEKKRGHIVFISSISGKVATQGQAMYNCTKFGLRGFAFALREDLRAHGVGVSTVFPGFIRGAGMFAETGVELPAGGGTKTPDDVFRGVYRAVTKDLAEVDVAAFEQVLGGYIFPLAPSFITWTQKMFGGEAIAQRMSDAQKHKR